eukprot:TRINITY_DN5578_c0_g1_i1.p1 TRINITY_DN5578_c0_g1~~TRINITY_DN5578_c0_g1_i1.p1  ORF type:complete len:151 (+),score=14.08 TRINITY_DN5578_c0_g1_i1:71-523(+)
MYKQNTVTSAKSKLNLLCNRLRIGRPMYETKLNGPSHACTFSSSISLADQVFVGPECPNKKLAEQAVAELVLAYLKKDEVQAAFRQPDVNRPQFCKRKQEFSKDAGRYNKRVRLDGSESNQNNFNRQARGRGGIVRHSRYKVFVLCSVTN